MKAHEAVNLQSSSSQRKNKYGGGGNRRASIALQNQGGPGSGRLNALDVYVLGQTSERHTFSVLLSDGETRLHGHCLRYLPPHSEAKGRVDIGRRGVRAMILLTRAAGGDRFFTGVLK